MGSKKKPMSMDEKKNKVCEFFLEKNDFFTFKEVEKAIAKEKGVVQQTVKDVLQACVDEGRIDSDKIGSSLFYWAFPSKVSQAKKRKLDEITSSIETQKEKISELEKQIEIEKKSRVESEERTELLKELEELENISNETSAELEKYKENDPEILNKKKLDAEEAMKHANRWTDNIFAIQQYCSSKFNLSSSEFFQQFQLPEDFDYPT